LDQHGGVVNGGAAPFFLSNKKHPTPNPPGSPPPNLSIFWGVPPKPLSTPPNQPHPFPPTVFRLFFYFGVFFGWVFLLTHHPTVTPNARVSGGLFCCSFPQPKGFTSTQAHCWKTTPKPPAFWFPLCFSDLFLPGFLAFFFYHNVFWFMFSFFALSLFTLCRRELPPRGSCVQKKNTPKFSPGYYHPPNVLFKKKKKKNPGFSFCCCHLSANGGRCA